MPRRKPASKWADLGESGRRQAVARAVSVALDEPRTVSPQSPLVGLFCLEWSRDSEHTKYGDNWSRQARVEAVVGGTAMLQFFDAMMGDPSSIAPVPLSVLLGGLWTFYRDPDDWRHAAESASERYWRGERGRYPMPELPDA